MSAPLEQAVGPTADAASSLIPCRTAPSARAGACSPLTAWLLHFPHMTDRLGMSWAQVQLKKKLQKESLWAVRACACPPPPSSWTAPWRQPTAAGVSYAQAAAEEHGGDNAGCATLGQASLARLPLDCHVAPQLNCLTITPEHRRFTPRCTCQTPPTGYCPVSSACSCEQTFE